MDWEMTEVESREQQVGAMRDGASFFVAPGLMQPSVRKNSSLAERNDH
jgi:hypothetical protein